MHTNALSLVPRSFARRSGLVQYLAVAYTLLVAYASLYPFAPWRQLPSSPFAFLFEPWPRYYTAADVALNVLGYLPFGLLLTLAAMAWTTPRWAALSAVLAGTWVSLSMETLQSFLPPRVPSNLDLLSNSLGVLVGALIAVAGGGRWLLNGQLYRLRSRMFWPGAGVDAGFVILLLWLFTQLYPAVWLFGNGDLRFLFQDLHNLAYSPESYRWIEAGVTALNLAGIALLMSSLARIRAEPDRTVSGVGYRRAAAEGDRGADAVQARRCVALADARLHVGDSSRYRGVPGIGMAAQNALPCDSGGAAPWRRWAGEYCTHQPVYPGLHPDLVARALPELQRHHTLGVERLAVSCGELFDLVGPRPRRAGARITRRRPENARST